MAVAEAKGCDPVELSPLQSVIDTDALDTLFDSSGRSSPRDVDRRFEFTYAGHRVSVFSDGSILGGPAGVTTRDGPTTDTAFQSSSARLVQGTTRNSADVEDGGVGHDGDDRPVWAIGSYQVPRSDEA